MEEEVNLSGCEVHTDAYRRLGHFLGEVCTRKRIHFSLGYLIPAEFACPPVGEAQWLMEQAALTART